MVGNFLDKLSYMERSPRNILPYSSNRKFEATFASPNRYFTENSLWVSLLNNSFVSKRISAFCSASLQSACPVCTCQKCVYSYLDKCLKVATASYELSSDGGL